MRQDPYLRQLARPFGPNGVVPALRPPRLLFRPTVLPSHGMIESGLMAETFAPVVDETPLISTLTAASATISSRSDALRVQDMSMASRGTGPLPIPPNAPEQPVRQQSREEDEVLAVAPSAPSSAQGPTSVTIQPGPIREELVEPALSAPAEVRQVLVPAALDTGQAPDVTECGGGPDQNTTFLEQSLRRLKASADAQPTVIGSQNPQVRMIGRSSLPRNLTEYGAGPEQHTTFLEKPPRHSADAQPNSQARMTGRSSLPRTKVKPFKLNRAEASPIVELVNSAGARPSASDEPIGKNVVAERSLSTAKPTSAPSPIPVHERLDLFPPALPRRKNHLFLDQNREPGGGVHIGSLEVRITSSLPASPPGFIAKQSNPPQPSQQPGAVPRTLSRGFVTFGLVQT